MHAVACMLGGDEATLYGFVSPGSHPDEVAGKGLRRLLRLRLTCRALVSVSFLPSRSGPASARPLDREHLWLSTASLNWRSGTGSAPSLPRW